MRGLPLPLGLLGVGNVSAVGIRSTTRRPTAAQIASALQPAWHLTSARPSSPSPIDRLARRSSWAGQRADQPLPACLASGSFANSRSTGVIVAPFRRFGLPGQPGLQVGHRVQHGLPLAVPDANAGNRARRGVSPQRVRAIMPRAFAASRGRRARDSSDCVAIVDCSNRSLAAKCGLHGAKFPTMGQMRVAKRQRPDKCRAAECSDCRPRIATKSFGATTARQMSGRLRLLVCRRQVAQLWVNPRDRETGGYSVGGRALRASNRHPGSFAGAPIAERMRPVAWHERQARRQVPRAQKSGCQIGASFAGG